jgi:hypothetical protein
MGIRHRGNGMIVAGWLSRKGGETVLSVAARQSSICCDCRVGRRPASASLAFEGGATAVAFDVHLEDGGVMNEAVDDSDRHCLVREDFAPFAEGLVGGDEERAPLIAGADELKEHAGFGLVFGDVGDVIEDQQVEFVELGDGGFEREVATGNLQPLDQIDGAGEQYAPAVPRGVPLSRSTSFITGKGVLVNLPMQSNRAIHWR